MTTSLSIIIPSFNSAGTVERVLTAIGSQSCKAQIGEVIVVDSSDDGKTRDSLRRFQHPKVKAVFLDQKSSPAIGRNIGAKAATGDLLIFVDSDVCPDTNCFEKILGAYEKGCRVGGGSLAVPESQKNKPVAWAQYFLQFNEFMDCSKERRVPFVPSAILFCERQLFRRIKGFPEIRAAEDVLFGLNASKITDVRFIPEAKACHIFREEFSRFMRNQALLGKYALIYRRRQLPDTFYCKGLWPLIFLPGFLIVKFLKITIRILRSNFDYFLKYLWVLPIFLLGLISWGYGFAGGVFSDEK